MQHLSHHLGVYGIFIKILNYPQDSFYIFTFFHDPLMILDPWLKTIYPSDSANKGCTFLGEKNSIETCKAEKKNVLQIEVFLRDLTINPSKNILHISPIQLISDVGKIFVC